MNGYYSRRVRTYDRHWDAMLKDIEEAGHGDPTEEGQNRGNTMLGLCVVFGLHTPTCDHWLIVEAPDAEPLDLPGPQPQSRGHRPMTCVLCGHSATLHKARDGSCMCTTLAANGRTIVPCKCPGLRVLSQMR